MKRQRSAVTALVSGKELNQLDEHGAAHGRPGEAGSDGGGSAEQDVARQALHLLRREVEAGQRAKARVHAVADDAGLQMLQERRAEDARPAPGTSAPA